MIMEGFVFIKRSKGASATPNDLLQIRDEAR
jgi:hypothetical protein